MYSPENPAPTTTASKSPVGAEGASRWSWIPLVMEFLLVPIDSNLASSTPGIGVSYRPSRGLSPRPAGTVIRTEVTATTPNPRPILRCVRDDPTCPRCAGSTGTPETSVDHLVYAILLRLPRCDP